MYSASIKNKTRRADNSVWLEYEVVVSNEHDAVRACVELPSTTTKGELLAALSALAKEHKTSLAKEAPPVSLAVEASDEALLPTGEALEAEATKVEAVVEEEVIEP